MVNIVNSTWYTTAGGHTIGIVETYDEITKETKFRIGVGDGVIEHIDARRIATHGGRFRPEVFIKKKGK